MWRLVLAAALVSIVSGCVTSERPLAQRSGAIRSSSIQQAPRVAEHAPKPQQTTAAPIMIGAAY